MTVKNLILDLDNTLYGYDAPHKIAMSAVLESFSAKFDIPKELVQRSFDKARQNTHLDLPCRAASHNRLLYFQKLLEYNTINSMHHALDFYELYWSTFLEKMTLFEGVLDYLERHRKNSDKICILTDLTAHIQFRKIEKLGLAEYVDFLVTSEEVGIEKPDAAMFTRALQKLDCNASESLMVGDSWSKDILGASAMGIPSIWINHKNETQTLTENMSEVSCFEEILSHGK